MPSKDDLKFMRRALFLAQNKAKHVSPNPRVGAVLVRGGRILAEGFTQPFGGPHAEVMALKKAGPHAKGATLYVTLEPCSHHGKTPPCADALIRAGVGRVVAATGDPFPLVKGRGFHKLRQAGIRVRKGLLERKALEINEAFFYAMIHHRPKVLLKAAVSLDGKITTVSGRSRWITGQSARRINHQLRSRADAILVGIGTALKDNPSLTVRLPGFARKDGWPLRVVLDSRLRIRPGARVFLGKPKTVIFTSLLASKAKEKALLKRGAMVFRIPFSRKMLSLKAVLRILHSLQVRSLMVEGGGQVHASFIREKRADEAALFISPKVFGGEAPTWVGGRGIENPNRAPYLKDIRVERVGQDLLLTGKF